MRTLPIFLFLAVAFVAYHLYVVANSGGDVHPEVTLERTRVDFGTVSAGATLRATFAVRNTGRQRLILLEKGTSCECALATSEIIVQPRETRNLVAEVDTTDVSGPMRLEIAYSTNDPCRPMLTLILMVNVASTSATSPANDKLPLEPIAAEPLVGIH